MGYAPWPAGVRLQILLPKCTLKRITTESIIRGLPSSRWTLTETDAQSFIDLSQSDRISPGQAIRPERKISITNILAPSFSWNPFISFFYPINGLKQLSLKKKKILHRSLISRAMYHLYPYRNWCHIQRALIRLFTEHRCLQMNRRQRGNETRLQGLRQAGEWSIQLYPVTGNRK